MARVTPAGVVTMIINQKISAVYRSLGNADTVVLEPQYHNAGHDSGRRYDRAGRGHSGSRDGRVWRYPGFKPHSVRRVALLGQQSKGHQRTELIVFLTPHVLYDTNMTVEAADELRGRMKLLQKIMRNDKDQQ